MLLIGAALFIRSYSTLLQMKPGFSTSNVLIVNVDIRRAVSPGQRLPINRTDAGDSSKSSFRPEGGRRRIDADFWQHLEHHGSSGTIHAGETAAMMQCF